MLPFVSSCEMDNKFIDKPFSALHLNLKSILSPLTSTAVPTTVPVFVTSEAPAVPTTLKCTVFASDRSPSSPVRWTLQAESAANLRTLVLPSATAPDIATTLSRSGAIAAQPTPSCLRSTPFSHWKAEDVHDCLISDNTTAFWRSTSFFRNRPLASAPSHSASSSSSMSATLTMCSYFLLAKDSRTLRAAVSSGSSMLKPSAVSPAGIFNTGLSPDTPRAPDAPRAEATTPSVFPRSTSANIPIASDVSFSSTTLCSCIAV